jgi:predicted DNA-binding transcriptional regulator YafY
MQFSEEELAALRLGARLVKAWADHRLAEAAAAALFRIEAALPESLRDQDDAGVQVHDYFITDMLRRRVGEVRTAVAEKRRTWIRYRSADEVVTERIVRPVALFYWGGGWTAGAWCELRADFRDFRLDRIVSLQLLEPYEEEVGRMIQDYLVRSREKREAGW